MKLSQLFENFNNIVRNFYIKEKTSAEIPKWKNTIVRVKIERESITYRLRTRPFDESIPKYGMSEEQKKYLHDHELDFYIQISNVGSNRIITQVFPHYFNNDNINLNKDTFMVYVHEQILDLMSNRSNIDLDIDSAEETIEL